MTYSRISTVWEALRLKLALAMAILAMFACFIPAALEGASILLKYGEEKGKQKLTHGVPWDQPEIMEEVNSLSGPELALPPISLQRLMENESRVKRLRDAVKQFSIKNIPRDPYAAVGDSGKSKVYFGLRDVEASWSNYLTMAGQRWSQLDIAQARRAYEQTQRDDWLYSPIMLDLALLVFKIGLGVVGTIFCSAIFFVPMLLIQGYGLKEIFWGEIVTVRLPLAMSFWPVMIFFYRGGDPREHMIRAMRAVATFASLLILNVLPGSINQAFGKTTDANKRAEYALILESSQNPVTSGPPAQEVVASPTPTPSPSPSPKPVHVTISTEIWPSYLGANGAIFHHGAVKQTTAVAIFSNKCHVGTFVSAALTEREVPINFGNEVDVFVGCSRTVRGVNLTGEANYVNVAPLKRIGSGDVVELSFTADRRFKWRTGSIDPFLRFRRPLPLNGKTPLGGWFGHVGVNHNLAVVDHFNVATAAEIMYDGKAFGFNRGWLAKFKTEGAWELGHGMTLKLPMFRFSSPLSHVHDGRKTEFQLGVGFALRN